MHNPRWYITIKLMIKLSITLPSGAEVSLESDDKDFVREVLYSTMPHLEGVVPPAAAACAAAREPVDRSNGHDLTRPTAPRSGNGHHPLPGETAPESGDRQPQPPASADDGLPAETRQGVVPEPVATVPVALAAARAAQTEPAPTPSAFAAPATPDEHEFIAFCQRVNPMGDMRRVVAAAEAADRYLSVRSVDPDELARLYTLAGWPIPHSFIQTLRNAARSKFRWMARINGKQGHYRVTDVGRKTVLGANAAVSGGSANQEYKEN